MKPFQQWLAAPVALGLIAPLAASAGELNVSDFHKYSGPSGVDQVTSIDQFPDVQPTDWAYQALSNLIERYGCVAGYPDGSFRGGKAMTRYEAAALLNACLDRITEITDELKRLMKEFERELAILRGRVDGLEAKVGELEATQFSTTTVLKGDAVFVIGANSFGGSQDAPFIYDPVAADTPLGALADFPVPAGTDFVVVDGEPFLADADGDLVLGPDGRPVLLPAGIPGSDRGKYPRRNRRNSGATVFNYDVRLNLETSFTGKDLLYTRLRSGNFNDSPFGGSPYNLMALDRAFSPTGGADVINIDRLYYRFPVSRDFTALVGAKARNTEFLGIKPWFYNASILDVYALNGAPGTYNKATGSAFGLRWKQKVKKGNPFFTISTSYVAANGENGDPEEGGLFTKGSEGNFLTQIGVAAPQWAITGAWRYGQCGQNFRRGTQFARQTQACGGRDKSGYSNNFAVTAAWQPKESRWIPSINLGWGYNDLNQGLDINDLQDLGINPYYYRENISASQSWAVALQWQDTFIEGNAMGMAVGQPVFATKLEDGSTPNDGNYVWEWWYRFQVTDNISVTPALFYLSRPGGQYTIPGEDSNVFGGLVQTRFKF